MERARTLWMTLPEPDASPPPGRVGAAKMLMTGPYFFMMLVFQVCTPVTRANVMVL